MSRAKRHAGTAEGEEAPVSKSERKRQAARLQDLGRQLTELNPSELDELPVSDTLRAAIEDYRRFGANEARRRQLQYIGRLMRDEDVTPLQEGLATLRGHSAEAHYEFHLLERWRERLVDDPAALTEFLSEYPGADAQQLRHKIAQVRRARTDHQRRTAFRALFRFLRDTLHPA